MNSSFFSSAVLPRTSLIFGLFLFLALTLSSPVFAEKEPDNPAAFRDKLYDVRFISKNEVFAVGYPGMILHSKDGGAGWKQVGIKETEAFYSIDFAGATHGWIVGRSGVIFATKDGGKSWSRQKTDVTEPIFDVDFFDKSNGIAVGNFGTILTTSDGGTTWTTRSLAMMQSAQINGVFMTGPKSAYLVGDYPHWETELVEEVTAEHISNMWATNDGGVTWERVPTGVAKSLFSMIMVDQNRGYATGSAGTLLKTEDGAKTWTTIKTPHDNLLVKIVKVGKSMYIAGTEGVVLKVENNKVTELNTKTYTWLNGIGFGDSNHGVAVGGRGSILYTTDGGKTWTKHPIK